eukprot:TRINITY_DN19922_c0_g1_i1.p1 TRINITY_DN19922_c0_g1~~TRINITY_DN19922_c0_g1_i1.p1  ORF type:complete len:739 (+),score=142.14 TRINITY_DN19922_c0_g1_i1:507-2723(+)
MSGEYDDNVSLLRSQSFGKDFGIEAPKVGVNVNNSDKRRNIIRRLLSKSNLSGQHPFGNPNVSQAGLGQGAPPEWALLLIGCLLGLGTGLCVALFNYAVHTIHEWSWAGTPSEGAAWLRLQRLANTWHRILLIPLTGGVIVGVMHGLLEIIDQIKQSRPHQRQRFDLVGGLCPTIKATQAAVTLGTGCSLGPEGPSVDIGKSCAYGLAETIPNNWERRIALEAAGAAAGISSGFNAAVAGCFFAIETVLRPQRAENSPPFTTAMIILASVLSSTVTNVIFGGKQAFTVPTYELKSVAELPLYLLLGMICGVVSVAFTHLVAWFTKLFEFIKEHSGMPAVINPALGGLGAGLIALRYPGILYWGFTNVDEILHTGKSASAPGIWLLTQLIGAKVVATSLCKGSGLVGGLYAPSLMIGAAVGAVFGGLAADIINAVIPGNEAVAHPQAYALVGMAATLASACSVPLTSVLLLFEMTKDYRILIPLMGAVGLAFWVASVANQPNENEHANVQGSAHAYTALTNNTVERNGLGLANDGDSKDVELGDVEKNSALAVIIDDHLLNDIKVSQAMTSGFRKVLVTATLKEAMQLMLESCQNCILIVSEEDMLEGILTLGDVQRKVQATSSAQGCDEAALLDVNTFPVSSICTRRIYYHGSERGILVCYPDMDLMVAKEIMEAGGVRQLPVVVRNSGRKHQQGQKLLGLLCYDSIRDCLRDIRKRHSTPFPQSRQHKDNEILHTGH